MSLMMGIDLGTSSVKVCVVTEDGEIVSKGRRGYKFDVPRLGWAEQRPETWWDAVVYAIRQCVQALRPKQAEGIKSIGLSGQMHGLVCIDRFGAPVRPAILHCDQRTGDIIREIYDIIPAKELGEIVCNRVSTGFLLPSLMWVKKHERQNFDRIWKVMLPKDYIRYQLTGEIATEESDASGTLLFDVKKRCWAYPLLERLEIPRDILPACHASADIAGTLEGFAARELGLQGGIKVVYGGSDQAMQAFGNGVIEEGVLTSNIGTSGQVYSIIGSPQVDASFDANIFCNIFPGRWYAMGAIMCAGMALEWFTHNVIENHNLPELDEKAARVPPGSEGLIFLPHLMGERLDSPLLETKGMLFGLSVKHDYTTISRAMMEGVCFALKSCHGNLQKYCGRPSKKIIASGGGAKSALWLQMQADILEREVGTTINTEHACLGAAMVAGMGTGVYKSAQEACAGAIRYSPKKYEPIAANVKVYREVYGRYMELYTRNKGL